MKPTEKKSALPFLRFTVTEEVWREAQYPIEYKGRVATKLGTAAQWNDINKPSHQCKEAVRSVKVLRLLGFGSTAERAVAMAFETRENDAKLLAATT